MVSGQVTSLLYPVPLFASEAIRIGHPYYTLRTLTHPEKGLQINIFIRREVYGHGLVTAWQNFPRFRHRSILILDNIALVHPQVEAGASDN